MHSARFRLIFEDGGTSEARETPVVLVGTGDGPAWTNERHVAWTIKDDAPDLTYVEVRDIRGIRLIEIDRSQRRARGTTVVLPPQSVTWTDRVVVDEATP